MVLAFEEEETTSDSKDRKWEDRATFEENLRMAGLELELEHRSVGRIEMRYSSHLTLLFISVRVNFCKFYSERHS